MNKKYIIEKNDLQQLPSSYYDLGLKYSSNFDKINRLENKIEKSKKLISELSATLLSLNNENIQLYNQLKFIKRNYVPSFYINVYTKNQKPTKYVNLIIKYFDFSKTIYLGKKLDLNLLLIEHNKNANTFNQSLIEILKPSLLVICSTLKNKFEFIDLKITLDLLLDKKFESNNTENTFSSYLKQFE